MDKTNHTLHEHTYCTWTDTNELQEGVENLKYVLQWGHTTKNFYIKKQTDYKSDIYFLCLTDLKKILCGLNLRFNIKI